MIIVVVFSSQTVVCVEQAADEGAANNRELLMPKTSCLRASLKIPNFEIVIQRERET